MTTFRSPWNTLPPELFDEIPKHLPIVCCPATLLSLALTCRHFCDIIIPHLLYRAVWLESEDRALSVLSRLNTQVSQGAPFSRHIRYLAIFYAIGGRNVTRWDRAEGVKIIPELLTLVRAGGLRNLMALSLHNSGGRIRPENQEHNETFWDTFRENCPKVTYFNLTGIDPTSTQMWIKMCSSFKGLKSLRMNWLDPLDNYRRRLLCDSIVENTSSIEELKLICAYITPGQTSSVLSYIMSLRFPNLRTLLIDAHHGYDETIATDFWINHPKIERLEILGNLGTSRFLQLGPSHFLNLRTLKCTFSSAMVILPQVHSQLVNLTLLHTVNAQALYLLRVIVPGGSMPRLRSLGIQLKATTDSSPIRYEGNRWYEDDEGNISEKDSLESMRYFDENYLATLARAVPELEELELEGHSGDTLDAFTSSLQRFRRLRMLTLSEPADIDTIFFRSALRLLRCLRPLHVQHPSGGLYAPNSFEVAAYDLGNGCRTLDHISITGEGRFPHPDDVTAAIVRDGLGGPVKDLRICKGWGRLIGREDEW